MPKFVLSVRKSCYELLTSVCLSDSILNFVFEPVSCREEKSCLFWKVELVCSSAPVGASSRPKSTFRSIYWIKDSTCCSVSVSDYICKALRLNQVMQDKKRWLSACYFSPLHKTKSPIIHHRRGVENRSSRVLENWYQNCIHYRFQ